MKKLVAIGLLVGSLVSSQAQGFFYNILLSGPSSPGTGSGTAFYNTNAHSLQIVVSFSGLTGTTGNAHIHGPTASPLTGTAGVITTTPSFSGFPVGVTSGTFSNTLDLTLASSYNPTFVSNNGGTPASAEAAFAAALNGGRTYFNIHTSTFGGGEISGFLVPVPEPSTYVLGSLGALALAFGAWRKRSAK